MDCNKKWSSRGGRGRDNRDRLWEMSLGDAMVAQRRSSNTLATWFEEPTHWKWPILEKMKAKGGGSSRGWDGQHHRLNGCESEQTRETVEDRGAWGAAVCGVAKSWARLSDWTATKNDGELLSCLLKNRELQRWLLKLHPWKRKTFFSVVGVP